MPSLANHQSNEFTKLLIEGDSKCLAADTIVSVTRGRSRSKHKTLEELFNLHQSPKFDPSLETYLTCDVGGYSGLNRMQEVVYSGVKPVRTVQAGRRIIRATEDHLFDTDDGWLPLSQIRPKHRLIESRFNREGWVGGIITLPKNRVIIYSIPYHPYAMDNWVNGFNYKRDFRARLVVEASMNGMTLEELVSVLRKNENRALELKYLPRNVDVHHINTNAMDDRLENLIPINRDDHLALHEASKASWATSLVKIDSISEPEKARTYDIVMADPHRNFFANGLKVHNSGKTGSLASLVAAGYHLRILDFDNGLDVLKQFVLDQCPQHIDNVESRTLRDQREAGEKQLRVVKPKAFTAAYKMIDEWKYTHDGKEYDYGEPASWGPECILVIDSLTFMCDAALDHHRAMDSKNNDPRAAFYAAQGAIANVLAHITSESFRTNVIVISHVKYMEIEGKTKGYPVGVGSALSPTIPRYFNSVIRYVTKSGGKREIETVASSTFDLANPRPFKMEAKLDVKDGLAKFFETLRPKVVESKPNLRKVK